MMIPRTGENKAVPMSWVRRGAAAMDAGGFEVVPDERERDAAEFPHSMWLRVIEAVVARGDSVLRMREYKVHRAPAELGRLRTLTSLDLSFNALRELPEELGELVLLYGREGALPLHGW